MPLDLWTREAGLSQNRKQKVLILFCGGTIIMKEGKGGALRAPTVKALVENGIPVLGHIGLTPQSFLALGGYKVQGRKPEELEQLLRDAAALEAAGVFALVLECVPPEVGREITDSVGIPTIGIGAGPHCDGPRSVWP